MRVACYVRVSSQEQARDGFSLAEQEHLLREWVKNNNHTLVDVYIDEGVSASKQLHLRHGFQRMLSELDKIDLIAVIKLDRFFRNVRDYYKVMEILEQNNVGWDAILEDYDTTTANGRLFLQIRLAVAESESANTSERIKMIQEAKIRNGEPITGLQPLGYKVDIIDGKKKVVVDPQGAEMVRLIFDTYLSTLSLSTTCEVINETYGKSYTNSHMSLKLRDTAYLGLYKGNPNYYPRLIDDETHELVVRTLTQRRRDTKTKWTYPFSGLIRCPKCGRLMCGRYQTKATRKTPYISYACPNKFMKKGPNHCDMSSISQKWVERDVLEALGDFVVNLTATPKKKKAESPVKYENQLKRLTDAYIMGNVDKAEYERRQAELRLKISSIRAKKNDEGTIPQDVIKLLGNTNFKALYAELTDKERQVLWRTCIKSIEYSEEKKIIKVNWVE